MAGLKNILQAIYDNWSLIIICAGLVVAIYQKAVTWLHMSENEKISIAKEKIKETILKYISDAEIEYENITESGNIKRSVVIAQIFKDYPILEKVINQHEIIAFIDALIDSALPILRNVLEKTSKNIQTPE